MIKAQTKLFVIGLRQVLRDGMLLLLLPSPFLYGVGFRLLMPWADAFLRAQFSFSLIPWFPLSDALLMALTPFMVAVSSAFLMLDERDQGVGSYFGVTPAGGRAYLLARLGWPMLWAFCCTLLVQSLFGLSGAGTMVVLSVSLISALQGVSMAMLLVSLAGNKVEGLALSKLTGMFLLGLPVPWLLGAPGKYLFAFMPSFWISELMRSPTDFAPLLLLSGLLAAVAWIAGLTGLFLRRAKV